MFLDVFSAQIEHLSRKNLEGSVVFFDFVVPYGYLFLSYLLAGNAFLCGITTGAKLHYPSV